MLRAACCVAAVLTCAACVRAGFDEAERGGDGAADLLTADSAVSGDGPGADAASPQDALSDAPSSPDQGGFVPAALPTVSAGGWHSCAIRQKGKIYCWGSNDRGQLGDGSDKASLVPVSVTGITDAVTLEASEQHTCALRAAGVLMCWGENNEGELGVGASTSSSTVPLKVNGVAGAVAVDAGWDHTCALLKSGEVMCWGTNDFGECGQGTKGTQLIYTPVKVKGLTDAVELDSGEDFTCARRKTGNVACWGSFSGSSSATSTLPKNLSSLADAVEIGAGSNHACAVRAGGQVVCWGSNSSGELGVASSVTKSSTTPVAVAGLVKMKEVVCGQNHTCARHASGEVSCWGWNVDGKLGRGKTEQALPDSHLPGKVLNLSDAVQLSSTEDYACALRKTGAVVCWGSNSYGQLGDGTIAPGTTPVTVKSLP